MCSASCAVTGVAVPMCRVEEGESGLEEGGGRVMFGGTVAKDITPVARVTLGAG